MPAMFAFAVRCFPPVLSGTVLAVLAWGAIPAQADAQLSVHRASLAETKAITTAYRPAACRASGATGTFWHACVTGHVRHPMVTSNGWASTDFLDDQTGDMGATLHLKHYHWRVIGWAWENYGSTPLNVARVLRLL
jgi:hypothetical protein